MPTQIEPSRWEYQCDLDAGGVPSLLRAASSITPTRGLPRYCFKLVPLRTPKVGLVITSSFSYQARSMHLSHRAALDATPLVETMGSDVVVAPALDC